jgi:hypothetical protein
MVSRRRIHLTLVLRITTQSNTCTRVPVSSTWRRMWRTTHSTAVPVSTTPPITGSCPQKGRPPKNTLKSSILSPLLMWRHIILVATQRTVAAGISSSAGVEPCSRVCLPWWGGEVQSNTPEVGRSPLTHYRDPSGCRAATRTWWWHYRWGWRRDSERSVSLCTRRHPLVTILTGTCSVTFIPWIFHTISIVQIELMRTFFYSSLYAILLSFLHWLICSDEIPKSIYDVSTILPKSQC